MPCGRYIKVSVDWNCSDWVAELSPGARLAWIMLLCHCREAGVNGTVKHMSYKTASRRWDIPESQIAEMYERAVEDGAIVLSIDEEGSSMASITNWDKYQDSSAERVRKWREKKGVKRDVTDVTLRNVTPPDGIQSSGTLSDTTMDIDTTDKSEPDVTLQNVTNVTVTLQHNTTHSVNTVGVGIAELAGMNPYQRAKLLLTYVSQRLGSSPPSDEAVRRCLKDTHPLQVVLKSYDLETAGEMYLLARKSDGTPFGWSYVAGNASALEAKLRGNATGNGARSVAQRALRAMGVDDGG